MDAVYREPGLPLAIPRPRPTFRPQRRALGLAFIVALAGFAIRWLEHAVRSPDTRLSPELVGFADALPFVLAATWVYAAWLVVRHGYWTVAHRSWLVRSLYVGGSVIVHGLAVTLLSGLLVIASPDWLFGPRAIASVSSPDGHSVGYLFGPGLLTGCSLYVRNGPELLVHRTAGELACSATDVPHARVVWSEGDTTPTAIGADGAPLPPSPPLPLFGVGGC